MNPEAAAAWLKAVGVPWWTAGGWAIDLHVGHQTPPHVRLDIGVGRHDVLVLQCAIATWDVFEAKQEH